MLSALNQPWIARMLERTLYKVCSVVLPMTLAKPSW